MERLDRQKYREYLVKRIHEQEIISETLATDKRSESLRLLDELTEKLYQLDLKSKPFRVKVGEETFTL